MKNIWKRVAVLIAVLCLTLACAMVACGDDEGETEPPADDTVTYTVKVVLPDADETPAEGVELTFCEEEDETKTQPPVKTNENGIAKITCKTANYRVKITDGFPEGYTLFNADSENYLTKNWNKPNCIITLDEAVYTYTVTVTLPNSEPASGVDVIFTPNASGAEAKTVKTGLSGKASITLPADINYLVTLDGDTLPGNTVISAEDEKGISTLNGTSIYFALENPVTYTFSVTGPEGANLEGIEVSYSETAGGRRTPLGVTDANGTLTIERSAIAKFAYIKSPEGYVYNEYYGESKCPYLLTKKTIKFTLLKCNELVLQDKMSDSAIQAFKSATGSDGFTAALKEVGRAAYSSEYELGEGETQIFSFKAEETGTYSFFANFSNAEINVYKTLDLNDPYTSLPGKSLAITFDCTKGESYYFSVKANAAQSIQLVVVTPAEKNEYKANGTGDYTVAIKENMPAMLYFRPSVSGEYTVTIQNGASGYHMQQISSANLMPMIGTDSVNGTSVFTATHSELFDAKGDPSSTKWIFRITSTADVPSYPIELTVTITRTGDAIEKESVIEHAAVQTKLTKYADKTGTLKAVGVSGAQVVKGNDGYYRYGNANGPIVVIKLKGEINPFYVGEDGAILDFSTLDQSGNNYYNFYTHSDDTHNYYVSYARFLRGYAAYSAEPAIEVQEYYLKYVNKDGVYPLNDELKTFLEYVARDNASWFTYRAGSSAQKDSLWLFSAYYYEDTETASIQPHTGLTVWKKEN